MDDTGHEAVIELDIVINATRKMCGDYAPHLAPVLPHLRGGVPPPFHPLQCQREFDGSLERCRHFVKRNWYFFMNDYRWPYHPSGGDKNALQFCTVMDHHLSYIIFNNR